MVISKCKRMEVKKAEFPVLTQPLHKLQVYLQRLMPTVHQHKQTNQILPFQNIILMRLDVCGWLSVVLVCCCLVAQAQQREWKESYYPDGKLRYKGYFVGKQPVGEVTQYYPSGQMKARLNYDGEEMTAIIYSKNGGRICSFSSKSSSC